MVLTKRDHKNTAEFPTLAITEDQSKIAELKGGPAITKIKSQMFKLAILSCTIVIWTLAFSPNTPLAFTQNINKKSLPNLGYLGCSGTPEKAQISIPADKEERKASAIRIQDIYPIKKTLASVLKLKTGDKIVKIGDHYLEPSDNLVMQFVDYWERMISKKKKKITLGFIRRDKYIEIKLPVLAYQKPFLDVEPKNCKRWKASVKLGFDYLKKSQGRQWESGSGGVNGQVFVSAIAGFAYLSKGNRPNSGPYKKQLAACVNFVISGTGTAGDGLAGGGANWNQENWAYGIAAAFLSEVYRVFPNPKYLSAIQGYVDKICANQESSGGWGHGPGGPNALGYVELNIVSGWCLLGLGLAERAGVTIPEDTVKKGVDYCISSTVDGKLGYSANPGQKGMGNSGRNALAILALLSLSYPAEDPYVAALLKWSNSLKKDTIIEGHPAPAMHVACSAMLSRRVGGENWKRFYEQFRLLFAAIQRPDGAFTFYETNETKSVGNNADVGQGLGWNTALYTLVETLPKSKLSFVTGKKPKGWSKERTTVQ